MSRAILSGVSAPKPRPRIVKTVADAGRLMPTDVGTAVAVLLATAALLLGTTTCAEVVVAVGVLVLRNARENFREQGGFGGLDCRAGPGLVGLAKGTSTVSCTCPTAPTGAGVCGTVEIRGADSATVVATAALAGAAVGGDGGVANRRLLVRQRCATESPAQWRGQLWTRWWHPSLSMVRRGLAMGRRAGPRSHSACQRPGLPAGRSFGSGVLVRGGTAVSTSADSVAVVSDREWVSRFEVCLSVRECVSVVFASARARRCASSASGGVLRGQSCPW